MSWLAKRAAFDGVRDGARGGASFETRLVTDLLSLFLALPLGSVLIIIRYGPASASGAPIFGDYALPFALAVLVLGAVAYRLAFAVSRPMRFVAALWATVAALVLASMAMGILIHRDFFTAAFQYSLGAFIAVLYHVAARPSSSQDSKGFLRALSKAGLIVSFFYVEWIMLMGYAISTRAEPRPVESILYNVYNLAQVLILLLTSRWVERKTFHRVMVEGKRLEVDGRDLLSVLGQKKAEIFRGFVLAADRSLRCSEIQALFREEADEAADERCASCTEQTTKVALCSRYRNTYNSILELKRVLEFLEIGTITAPENKRRILTDGWKLALFENARLIVRKR
jgi:hypothetical protein